MALRGLFRVVALLVFSVAWGGLSYRLRGGWLSLPGDISHAPPERPDAIAVLTHDGLGRVIFAVALAFAVVVPALHARARQSACATCGGRVGFLGGDSDTVTSEEGASSTLPVPRRLRLSVSDGAEEENARGSAVDSAAAGAKRASRGRGRILMLGVLLLLLTYFGEMVGWGPYTPMGTDWQQVQTRSDRVAAFDWLVGAPAGRADGDNGGSGWQFWRLWARDAAALSLRGLVQTVPSGLAMYLAGYGFVPALFGLLMAPTYWLANAFAPSGLGVTGFEGGGELAEALWGTMTVLTFVSAVLAFPVPHDRHRHKVVRLPESSPGMTPGDDSWVSGQGLSPSPGPVGRSVDAAVACAPPTLYVSVRELATERPHLKMVSAGSWLLHILLWVYEAVLGLSCVSIGVLNQRDMRNRDQTLLGLCGMTLGAVLLHAMVAWVQAVASRIRDRAAYEYAPAVTAYDSIGNAGVTRGPQHRKSSGFEWQGTRLGRAQDPGELEGLLFSPDGHRGSDVNWASFESGRGGDEGGWCGCCGGDDDGSVRYGDPDSRCLVDATLAHRFLGTTFTNTGSHAVIGVPSGAPPEASDVRGELRGLTGFQLVQAVIGTLAGMWALVVVALVVVSAVLNTHSFGCPSGKLDIGVCTN